jgi:hypothetical protein
LLCEVCDFDTPLWTANQYKDFLVFISICMPVPSKDNVCVLSFCPALILPFSTFPLLYMLFYIWHCGYGIFYMTFSDFCPWHTHLQRFFQINTIVQYDTFLAHLLTYVCTCVSACPLWLIMYDWAPVPHSSTDRGSSCELVPINKSASLFP